MKEPVAVAVALMSENRTFQWKKAARNSKKRPVF